MYIHIYIYRNIQLHCIWFLFSDHKSIDSFDQVNLLLDHLPNHLPCSDKSNQRPKPAQLPDHPLQTDAVKHKT